MENPLNNLAEKSNTKYYTALDTRKLQLKQKLDKIETKRKLTREKYAQLTPTQKKVIEPLLTPEMEFKLATPKTARVTEKEANKQEELYDQFNEIIDEVMEDDKEVKTGEFMNGDYTGFQMPKMPDIYIPATSTHTSELKEQSSDLSLLNNIKHQSMARIVRHRGEARMKGAPPNPTQLSGGPRIKMADSKEAIKARVAQRKVEMGGTMGENGKATIKSKVRRDFLAQNGRKRTLGYTEKQKVVREACGAMGIRHSDLNDTLSGETWATDAAAGEAYRTALLNAGATGEQIVALHAQHMAKHPNFSYQLLKSGTATKGGYAPFYLESGIIRGGGFRRGTVYGDKSKPAEAQFAIPVQVGDVNNKRSLTSLQAKYKNPSLFPTTRIVKFIAGNFGKGHTQTPAMRAAMAKYRADNPDRFPASRPY